MLKEKAKNAPGGKYLSKKESKILSPLGYYMGERHACQFTRSFNLEGNKFWQEYKLKYKYLFKLWYELILSGKQLHYSSLMNYTGITKALIPFSNLSDTHDLIITFYVHEFYALRISSVQ